jgi:hypothetical protein
MNPLFIVSVYGAGQPNNERIVVRASESCNTKNYFMGLALRGDQDTCYPLNDNFFWFGNGQIIAGDWIFLYTGSGEPTANDLPNQPNRIYTVYWRRSTVLFSSSEVIPYLGFMSDLDFAPSIGQGDRTQLSPANG